MTKIPLPETPPTRTYAHKVFGEATWYCNFDVSRAQWSRCMKVHPDGANADLYAAAGPRLRAAIGPSWRGKTVTVWSGKRHVRVVLADWCACAGAHTIDLYRDAWEALMPVGIPVKITW